MDIGFFAMLAAQIHVLIGGFAGAGKSVLVNGIIYAILQHSPNAAKLILIDPKRVELYSYRKCPHCIKYGDTPETMQTALNFAIGEMERRYIVMQRAEIRETFEPDIYIIIDELADLLDVCGKPAMTALKRLLQLGRAAHIHIIAATQHVNRRTLPAELQINFSTIVALPQRTKIESRQMLGETGAELLTVGTCLYITPKNREPRRAEIPMIPEAELKKAVDRWYNPAPKPRPIQQPTQAPPAYQITPEPTPTCHEAPRKRGFLAELIKNIL